MGIDKFKLTTDILESINDNVSSILRLDITHILEALELDIKNFVNKVDDTITKEFIEESV